jgi:lipopolysaccharide/colanic/teichoic acid biosynthesis glycosyltransferase
MPKLYKPAYIYLIFDNLMLLLSFYVVLDWFPLTTNTPFDKYSLPSLYYFLTWFTCSYFLQRYSPLRRQNYFSATLKLFYTTLFVFLIYWALIYFFFKPYSGYVLLTISSGVFVINYSFLSLYFAYRFAVDYNESSVRTFDERFNAKVKPAVALDEDSYKQLTSSIIGYSGNKVLCFLKQNVDLMSGNTLVFVKTDVENLEMTPNYHYSAIVQLEWLNNMRGINQKLTIINEKLPDNGIFVCCFESKSTRKKRILTKYPIVVNYLLYSVDFLFKRVMPKIFLTRSFYYFVTNGKNRIFSKTEVLGRLYCFGFKVIHEKKVGDLTYVVSQRIKQPEPVQKRIYGPFIRLRRFGKSGKPFEVYKMRTMHPYSEYLQGYIYERNSLKAGGKFNRDIRVTTIGTLTRKYWLDELPMIFNLLKGEMKIVGVRPLSAQYFSLYSKELQEKRVKYKPGLLPPFYADMPRTLDEIQESEMNYLNSCESKGTFITDMKYFFKILKNILFKKARSS